MPTASFKTIETLAASSRARFVTLQAQEALESFIDWNAPMRTELIPFENVLYCMAVVYLARQKSISVRLMLVNKPYLNLVCLIDDKYVLDIERRDIPTKRFLSDGNQYRWLYISGPTSSDSWIKIIE